MSASCVSRIGATAAIPVVLAMLWSGGAGAQVCSCGSPCDVSLEGVSLTGVELVEACLSITLGNACQIEFPAWVTLRAGEKIVFANGFSLDADTELTVEIDPALACDPSVDGDGDFVDSCLDCDDQNPLVYPGALEDCNGVDDDCDWVVDNDVLCSDGLDCTADQCAGVAGCAFPLIDNHCLIQGQCYAAGTEMPGNPCWKCDPALATDDWSLNDGAPCNDNDICTAPDICDAGVCSGASVGGDSHESNDSLSNAADLGSVDDNEAWPKDSFQASLYPAGDEDWYSFYALDSLGTQGPRVRLSDIPQDRNYQLCLYYECDLDDDLTLTCSSGSSSSHSGLPGCCSSNSGSQAENVQFSPDCSSSWLSPDDSGTVYVRVFWDSGDWTCSNYQVEWGDD